MGWRFSCEQGIPVNPETSASVSLRVGAFTVGTLDSWTNFSIAGSGSGFGVGGWACPWLWAISPYTPKTLNSQTLDPLAVACGQFPRAHPQSWSLNLIKRASDCRRSKTNEWTHYVRENDLCLWAISPRRRVMSPSSFLPSLSACVDVWHQMNLTCPESGHSLK